MIIIINTIPWMMWGRYMFKSFLWSFCLLQHCIIENGLAFSKCLSGLLTHQSASLHPFTHWWQRPSKGPPACLEPYLVILQTVVIWLVFIIIIMYPPNELQYYIYNASKIPYSAGNLSECACALRNKKPSKLFCLCTVLLMKISYCNINSSHLNSV